MYCFLVRQQQIRNSSGLETRHRNTIPSLSCPAGGTGRGHGGYGASDGYSIAHGGIYRIFKFCSEYDFYFSECSENMYISWVAKPQMKFTFFHFIGWNKGHIHSKI